MEYPQTIARLWLRIAVIPLSLLLGAVIPASAQPVAQRRLSAEMHHRFVKKDYRGALTLALRLHQLSGNPDYLVRIGLCYDLLGKDRQALQHYQRYLTERPRAKNRRTVNARIVAVTQRFRAQRGAVVLDCVPRSATIVIDGRPTTERAPATLWLLPGPHRLSCRQAEYHSQTLSLTIARGDTTARRLVLVRRRTLGYLTVTSPGVARLVYLGGRRLGLTPLSRRSLKPGSHRISLRSVDGKPLAERQVTIQPGQETRIALLFSAPQPPNRRPYQIAAWTTLGLGVAALGVAIYANVHAVTIANTANRNAQTLTPSDPGYPTAVARFDADFRRARRWNSAGIGLYVASAALLSSSVILFVLTPHHRRAAAPRWRIGVSGRHVELVWRFD